MPRYPWNDGSNQPDICNRPTLPKKYWIDDPASILPLPPSGDRWFTRSARERKGRRVFENKFLNWLVGDRLNICKKMETENWCRNCKFSGDNSSTKEGSSPSSPLERDLPPRSCSWITTSAVPARLLPSPCFFPSCQPGDGCISRFSPRQVFLFRGVPSCEKLSLCLRFAFSNNSAKIFGWNPRRINRRRGGLP